jgi:ubiquinone/menaquinone biosynthesis C-methylase UbiE
MHSEASCWDKDYGRRGQLWGGAVHNLPSISPGSRVLELGCGNGKTFFALTSRGLEVTAIDFSPHAVLMSHRVALQSGTGEVAIADARELPFFSGTFDAVIAMHIIGHMYEKDRERIVKEASRVLREDGIICFYGFSCEDLRFGKGRLVEPQTFERANGTITHYFTEPEVQELFSGLAPVQVATERWTMRVRGKEHIRAEITGIFKKSTGEPSNRKTPAISIGNS